MPQPPLWEIRYQRAEDGSDPFPLFVSKLPPPAQVEWAALIRLLEKHGDDLRGERASAYVDGPRRFRGDEVLIVYRCMPAERVVTIVAGRLLH